MADFDPAFSDTGTKRLPTATERTDGFPCGPLDQELFNALFNRIEEELKEVINFAGLTPSDGDFTQLRQAIEAIIAGAGGGLDPSLYLLMSQARARLPIFPEWQTSDGKITVSSPAAGTIRIPAGITFMHRGVFPEVTSLTDFVSVASKTYHVRWSNATGLYTMEDLSDVGYNPTALPESDSTFDTTYDDMLIARVVTNSGNVPTITNLVNKDRIFETVTSFTSDPAYQDSTFHLIFENASILHDLSRAPQLVDLRIIVGSSGPGTSLISGNANRVDLLVSSRYGITFNGVTDYNGAVSGMFMNANYNAVA